MSNQITLTSDQKIAVGVSILDKGGEVIASLADMPGYTVKIESSNTDILGVTMREDGLNADLSTDGIGKANLTVSTTDENGNHLADSPDVTEITIGNAKPGKQNVTFGAPEPE
jgi:hypothetical protein